MYSVVMGQCTNAMRAKLESQARFKAVAEQSNTIELLRMIRDISFNFQSQKYDVLAIQEVNQHFYVCRQGKYMSVPVCLSTLRSSLPIKTWSNIVVVRLVGTQA